MTEPSASAPSPAPSVVVVGSIAFDTVETPKGRREKLQGGSASYSAIASALFAPTGLVGVVGDDFPDAYTAAYARAGIDLAGLSRAPGKTFHWDGTYSADMNSRRTNCTELNVFADFSPDLPATYRAAPFLCLGNIAPSLQARVLDQMSSRPFTMLDTMELWIDTARAELLDVVNRVDLLTVNEHEARALTGKTSLLEAARAILRLGPAWALVKKGEHGAFLMGRDGGDPVLVPAWPLEDVTDPTGAGDTFAGALIGSLASGGAVDREAFRRALLRATVASSCTCSAFGLEGLSALTRADLDARSARFRSMLP